MKLTRITLVGHYPPPVGGISTHVERLLIFLNKHSQAQVLDFQSRGPKLAPGTQVYKARNSWREFVLAFSSLRSKTVNLIHIHTSTLRQFSWIGPIMIMMLPNSTRAVLTLHGGGLANTFNNLPRWRQEMARRSLNRFDAIVAVNDHQAEFLQQKMQVPAGRLRVIPAFLPPPPPTASTSLRSNIAELKKHSDICLIISGKGLPFYGAHLVLQALEKLNCSNRRIGLIIALYDKIDSDYLEKLNSGLTRYPHLLFQDLPPNEFTYLLTNTDIFIRATDRDGDASSIREAAYFGLQVIASDCVKRPEGTLVFKTMDPSSLATAIDIALDDREKGKIHFDPHRNSRDILELYQELLGEHAIESTETLEYRHPEH